MRNLKIAVLLTLCSISLSACAETVRIAKPPSDKLVCAALPADPKLTPLDWSKVSSIEEAKALVFRREGETSDYIVLLRGAWFSCSHTVAWHRARNDALP